jgi:hypothetical protein
VEVIAISLQKGRNWVLMGDVRLVGGVPVEVIPEEGVDAVAVGGGVGVGES